MPRDPRVSRAYPGAVLELTLYAGGFEAPLARALLQKAAKSALDDQRQLCLCRALTTRDPAVLRLVGNATLPLLETGTVVAAPGRDRGDAAASLAALRAEVASAGHALVAALSNREVVALVARDGQLHFARFGGESDAAFEMLITQRMLAAPRAADPAAEPPCEKAEAAVAPKRERSASPSPALKAARVSPLVVVVRRGDGRKLDRSPAVSRSRSRSDGSSHEESLGELLQRQARSHGQIWRSRLDAPSRGGECRHAARRKRRG